LTALAFGIAGPCQKEHKRTFAVWGTVLSSLALLPAMGLVVIAVLR